MDKFESKKFKQGRFTVQFYGWKDNKTHDYLEIEFDGGGGYYTQHGDYALYDEKLDEFLEECAKFKAWRDAR